MYATCLELPTTTTVRRTDVDLSADQGGLVLQKSVVLGLKRLPKRRSIPRRPYSGEERHVFLFQNMMGGFVTLAGEELLSRLDQYPAIATNVVEANLMVDG